MRISLLTLLLGFSAGVLADEPKAMGADWFAKLRNPNTRVEALYESYKRELGDGREADSPEEFAADHQTTLVFPAPQPGAPDAWAVVTLHDWDGSREILTGRDVDDYPPHPLEIERRREWNAAMEGANIPIWQPGQHWLDTLSGFLVEPSGKTLGDGFFASPGIIADVDGDGIIELIEVERHAVEKGSVKDAVIDCLEIGPLLSEAPRRVRLFTNFREKSELPRDWRFLVRPSEDGSLELVLTSTRKDPEPVTFHMAKGGSKSSGALPPDILLDLDPAEDSWSGPKDFLAKHGMKLSGIGSDSAKDIEAGRPSPPAWNSFEQRKWEFPDTVGLTARDAAQKIARAQFDPVYLHDYELVSIGKPIAAENGGWLEATYTGACFGRDTLRVWSLEESTAGVWHQNDPTTFLYRKIDSAELRRRISIIHELDRIRSIPKSPFAAVDDHDQMGMDGPPRCRIRVHDDSGTAVFEPSLPGSWKWVGSRYDRTLSSAIAAAWSEQADGPDEVKSIRELASIWLKPANVTRIPPALARAAIEAIAENRWIEEKPLLLALHDSLGPISADEARLDAIRLTLRETENSYRLQGQAELDAEKAHRQAARDELEWMVKLAGEPGFELRAAVDEALAKLEKDVPGSGDE